MTKRPSGDPAGVSYNPEIKKEKPSSQNFMESFLKNDSRDEVQIKKTAEYIFHLLAIVDDINTILAQLSHDKLLEEPVSQALQKVKQDCISMAMEQSLALPEEIQSHLPRLEQSISTKVEGSSVKKVLTEEEVNKIKGAKEAVYKAITMKRLIAKFVADVARLPVVQTVKGIYTSLIKISIKDSHNPDNLPLVVHTKVLPTVQSEQKGELPVIRHGISDEWTFRCYPWLKDKIPHSSYTLFSCSLDRVVDARGIVELSGMKKIEGLNLVDEDLSEDDERVMGTLLQSGARSREQTSLAEAMKAQDKAGKAVTDMYVTEKANGAYAACQVFKGPDGEALLFVASKTTPLLFKIPEGDSVKEKKKGLLKELERRGQTGSLDPLLGFIANESIGQLSQCSLDGSDLFNPDHPFWQRGMCVGEAEQGNHMIPLAGPPTIRWFKQTGLGASVSINSELEGLERVGLRTVKHYPIRAEQLAEKEKEWRSSKDIEGVVVYYKKADGEVLQIKYKAIPYIILRALRELLNGKRGRERFGFPWQQGSSAAAVLSSADRPEHVAQVIDDFLETHHHLLTLRKNAEFGSIVEENIKEYKRDFPRFIQFLLDRGYSEGDLGHGSAFGIGRLYKEFKETRITKIAERLPVAGYFQGLIIALSGPPGIGKDTVAEELARQSSWQNKPVILSKDRATEALRGNSSYDSSPIKRKAQQRFAWLAQAIQQAVQEKRPIIATTCNGSPEELAWITDAAKQHNLAVMPVYPEVSRKDMTAFSAALIVSVLRRQGHATLSASAGEAGASSNAEFAQVIKRRITGDLYTHGSADDRRQVPANDFYGKYLSTQLLRYFDLSAFDAFRTKAGLSEEQAKIQDALLDVVAFLDDKKQEISTESLTVLRDARESEINKIFQRTPAGDLSKALMLTISELKQQDVHYRQDQQERVRALEDKATYYGAFLEPESEAMLIAAVRKAFEKDRELPAWIQTYNDGEAAKPDAKRLKKKGASRHSTHLTLVHANLLHQLSPEAFAALEKNEGAEIRLEVREICYNEGVLYASNVRVLCQKEGDFEDKTDLLVASGMPHITLAMREGISPVYALHAEQARKAGAQGIKTLCFDHPLRLVAAVRTDLQNTRTYDNAGVAGKQKGKKAPNAGKDGHGDEHRGYASTATAGFFSSTKGGSPTSDQARAQVAVKLTHTP